MINNIKDNIFNLAIDEFNKNKDWRVHHKLNPEYAQRGDEFAVIF